VGTWLAEVYADAADWQARWHKALTAFTAYVLKPLHAFEAADASLTALFQALVDECAVLPLALEAEYRALAQTRPVEADALTVSLAWRQYKMLEKRGLAWPAAEEHLFLTAAAYTTETGLALEDDDEA
jgi:hypothetical protein